MVMINEEAQDSISSRETPAQKSKDLFNSPVKENVPHIPLPELVESFYDNNHNHFLNTFHLAFKDAVDDYLSGNYDDMYYFSQIESLQNILKAFREVENKLFEDTTDYSGRLVEALKIYRERKTPAAAQDSVGKIALLAQARQNNNTNSYLDMTELVREKDRTFFPIVLAKILLQEEIAASLPNDEFKKNQEKKTQRIKKDLTAMDLICSPVDYKKSHITMVLKTNAWGNTQLLNLTRSLAITYPHIKKMYGTEIYPTLYYNQPHFSYQVANNDLSIVGHIKKFLGIVFNSNINWLQEENKKLLAVYKGKKKETVASASISLSAQTRYEKLYKDIEQSVNQAAIDTEHKTQLVAVLQKIKAITDSEEVFSQIEPEAQFQLQKVYPQLIDNLVKQCLTDTTNYELTQKRNPFIAEALTNLHHNIQSMLEVKLLKDHKATAVVAQYLKAKR